MASDLPAGHQTEVDVTAVLHPLSIDKPPLPALLSLLPEQLHDQRRSAIDGRGAERVLRSD